MKKRNISAKQREVQNALRRIHRALQSHELDVRVRWILDNRSLDGDYRGDNVRNGRIRIDPWKNMVGTFVHELIHHLYPKKPHRRIYALETRIMRRASPDQITRLFHKLISQWLTTLSKRNETMPPCPICRRELPRVVDPDDQETLLDEERGS